MHQARILHLGLQAALLLTTGTLGSAALAGEDGRDWPQWRGPERTGISAESSWSSEGRPEPLWTKDLGLGHSSFAVADGRVYTLGYDAEAGLDSVFCFDAATGEEMWRHSYEAEIWDVAHDGGALTTPTVVDDVVYTSNREAKVFCFDAASGDVVWQRDLRADLELEPPTWGFSASPLVVGDHVFLNMDRVIALDRATGEEAWVSDSYGITYSTPTPFTLDGRDYLAVLSGSGLAVLDRGDGVQVDLYEWVKDPQIYPMSPVVIGDRIFISAGYDRGCAMLRLADGELEELWASRVMRNKMSGCVLFEGHLFGFDESILKCIDLDGKERWRERGMGTGSMTVAGGRLVILDGRGNVIVAEANPEEYVELSRQAVLDDGTAWSTPVLSHGRVYCRSSLGQMACLDYTGVQESARPVAEAREVPAAEEIVARHVAAVHGSDAVGRVTSVVINGTSESLINTVRTGDIELAWDAALGFRWSDASGFDFGHGVDFGWMVQPRGAPTVLRDADLEAVREAGDLSRLFDPAQAYASFGAVTARSFEGRDCYAVAATTHEGHARTLYFDVESGLYSGHDGDGISMWTVGAWKEFEGAMLPTEWSTYEPTNGERISARFDSVTINPEIATERFEAPESVAPFLRSPEEIERDNARLAELHAEILGEWFPEEDPSGAASVLEVRDGFLVMLRDSRDPAYLTEPAEDGSMSMLGASYVTFTPERGEDGSVAAIRIRVGGEDRAVMVRRKG